MPEPLYVSRSTIEKVQGLHRRARLETGVAVDFGVHGPIKEHYNLQVADDLPLPVDFLVAAAGGWMLGTLNGALEVRGVSLAPDAINATVQGINEIRDGLPVLTGIEVHYTLRVPTAQRDIVDRALTKHQSKCPTAATLAGAVEVSWSAAIEELGD